MYLADLHKRIEASDGLFLGAINMNQEYLLAKVYDLIIAYNLVSSDNTVETLKTNILGCYYLPNNTSIDVKDIIGSSTLSSLQRSGRVAMDHETRKYTELSRVWYLCKPFLQSLSPSDFYFGPASSGTSYGWFKRKEEEGFEFFASAGL